MRNTDNLMPPWPKGTSGNPKGRPSAGLTIKEWVNYLNNQDLNREELLKIIRKGEGPKTSAAIRVLRSREHPDMADVEAVLDGQSSLKELRTAGYDTGIVKKIKVKRRLIPNGDNPPIEEVEREIELHDRSLEETKAIIDYTDGKPKQLNEHTGLEGGPIAVKIIKGKASMDDI